METLKIAVVLGFLGSVVAVGLTYAWGAASGAAVGTDEVLRGALLSFLIAASVVVTLRWRPRRPGKDTEHGAP